MDDINLNDYIAAGYTLVKDVDRKYWHDEKLVPDRIISLSSCLGIQFDVVWAWNPTKYSDDIQAFGIPKSRFGGFENFNKLVWKQNDPGDPLIYSSLNFSQELARNFITDYAALHMIGIAIHRERALSEWPRHNPGDERFNWRIARGKSLEAGGKALGFEVVGVEFGTFACSWYCSGLENDMRELFGIRPGKYGLLQSYEEAKQVVDWIEEGDLGTRSEPNPYEAWLIVEYPLES